MITYTFATWGELALSPVGLSAVTKLAPKGRVGQMMGIWFVGAALGSVVAGLVGGWIGELGHPTVGFRIGAWILLGTGLVAIIVSPVMKRLIGKGIE